MTRYLLDTNVILRHLLAEPADQAASANLLFAAADRGEYLLVLTGLVVAEVVFTLESFYQKPKDQIAAVLTELIQQKGIEVEDGDLIMQSLQHYGSARGQFVDAYLSVASVAAGYPVVSFDRKFKALPGLKVISPKAIHRA